MQVRRLVRKMHEALVTAAEARAASDIPYISLAAADRLADRIDAVLTALA